MRMCSIASGSSGNCVYIGTETTHILVDAGISCRRIEQGLKALDLAGRDISGILITHEHADHIQGLGVLARRHHIPVYLTGGTADALFRGKALGEVDKELFHEIREDEFFALGDMQIRPFTVPHDAAQPVGYRVEACGRAAAVATDMGKFTDYIVDNLEKLDVMLIESNHDLNMLQVGPYPYNLKLRIMGDRGHLSNENAGRLLCRIAHDRLKTVLLGHLSKDNNYEELAYETVCSELTMGDNPYKAGDFDIRVAGRNEMSGVITF